MTIAEVKTAVFKLSDFRDAMGKCSILKTNRTPLPTTSFVLFEIKDNKATFTTTDLEKLIQVSTSCKSSDMKCLLPKSTVTKFLNGGDGELSFKLTKSNRAVLAREGLGSLSLDVYTIENFPPVPEVNSTNWTTHDAKWLFKMLKIVAVATAKDDNRPVLTGVAVEDGAMAAADGFRLNIFKHKDLNFALGKNILPIEGKMTEVPISKIIPYRTIEIVSRVFAGKELVSIGFNNDHIYFKSGDLVVIANLVQGTYPNYNKLVPTQYVSKISMSVPPMLQRLKMIDQIESTIMRLQFSKRTNSDVCLISGRNGDEFDFTLECPAKLLSGQEGKIAFNQHYIEDAIKPFNVVDIEINAPSSPGKFTGDIEGLTTVVMPMFVQW